LDSAAELALELRDPGAIARALAFSADTLIDLERKRRTRARERHAGPKIEDDSIDAGEDVIMHKLRFCLLALSRIVPPEALAKPLPPARTAKT
jgi:hypothetical protein